MTVQPQLLPPNVVPHWYAGGPALAAWRGLPPVGERSPEEWVGATVARFGEPDLGPARLADGTLLRDAVRADPRRLAWPRRRRAGRHRRAGETARRGPAAARARASHPRRTPRAISAAPTARPRRGTSWRPTTTPRCGSAGARTSTRPRARRSSTHRTPRRCSRSCTGSPCDPGDGVLVPGGTPHAIGAGILLVEAQEPTDQSILLERTNTTASDDGDLPRPRPRRRAVGRRHRGARRRRAADAARRRRGGRPGGRCCPTRPHRSSAWSCSTPGADVPAGFAVAVVLSGAGATHRQRTATPLDVDRRADARRPRGLRRLARRR